MKKAQSRWKLCSPSPSRFYSQRLRDWCFGKDYANARRSIDIGGARERGFLLVFLLPMLLLLLLFLAGSLRVAWRMQQRVALQSRLDVCALRWALERKSTLHWLARENQGIALTVLGIYAARGAKAAGPVGAVLGGTSEAVLLKMNASLAAVQEAQVQIAASRELARIRCEEGKFSRELAACHSTSLLPRALSREKTVFPDVKGTLSHSTDGRSLARFRCQSGQLGAEVEINGGRSLMKDDFKDAWTK